MNDIEFVLTELKAVSEPAYLKKMAHFGIDVSKAYGVRVPNIRKLAKQIGKKTRTFTTTLDNWLSRGSTFSNLYW